MKRRVPFIFLVALGLMAVPAIVAAAQPTLTTSVIPGHQIDVAGSGFPASADVLLVIQRNGVAAGSQTLRSDVAGSFSASIDAGPGRGGAYNLVATSGSAKAVADVVAVETAGAGTTGGLQQTPPPTDTVSSAPARPALDDRWAYGFVAAFVGFLLAGWRLRQRDKARTARTSGQSRA
jgi:hypothetical protein